MRPRNRKKHLKNFQFSNQEGRDSKCLPQARAISANKRRLSKVHWSKMGRNKSITKNLPGSDKISDTDPRREFPSRNTKPIAVGYFLKLSQ
jgi:hypothetical protein